MVVGPGLVTAVDKQVFKSDACKLPSNCPRQVADAPFVEPQQSALVQQRKIVDYLLNPAHGMYHDFISPPGVQLRDRPNNLVDTCQTSHRLPSTTVWVTAFYRYRDT